MIALMVMALSTLESLAALSLWEKAGVREEPLAEVELEKVVTITATAMFLEGADELHSHLRHCG